MVFVDMKRSKLVEQEFACLRWGADAVDPFSSAAWFDGWSDRSNVHEPRDAPVARARTWLLRIGWQWHGLLRAAPA